MSLLCACVCVCVRQEQVFPALKMEREGNVLMPHNIYFTWAHLPKCSRAIGGKFWHFLNWWPVFEVHSFADDLVGNQGDKKWREHIALQRAHQRMVESVTSIGFWHGQGPISVTSSSWILAQSPEKPPAPHYQSWTDGLEQFSGLLCDAKWKLPAIGTLFVIPRPGSQCCCLETLSRPGTLQWSQSPTFLCFLGKNCGHTMCLEETVSPKVLISYLSLWFLKYKFIFSKAIILLSENLM